MLNTYLEIDKYAYNNYSNVFCRAFHSDDAAMLNAVSTNELINVKITNRNSSCTKNLENYTSPLTLRKGYTPETSVSSVQRLL